MQCGRFEVRCALTHRSSGRSKACFAAFSPPLTFTLEPFFESTSGAFPTLLRWAAPRAKPEHTARVGLPRARSASSKAARAGLQALLGPAFVGRAQARTNFPTSLQAPGPVCAGVKGQAQLRGTAVRHRLPCGRFEVRCALTHRSSGRPKACFAAFSPPLTFTLEPFRWPIRSGLVSRYG